MTCRIEKVNSLKLYGEAVSNNWYDENEIRFFEYDLKKFRRRIHNELSRLELPKHSSIYHVQESWGNNYNDDPRIKAHWVAVDNEKYFGPDFDSLNLSGLYFVLNLNHQERETDDFWVDFYRLTLPNFNLEFDFERSSFQVLPINYTDVFEFTSIDYYVPVKIEFSDLIYRLRSIATLSALLSLGHRMDELRLRMELALETGFSLSDLKEIILQISLYAGFPRSLNGMACLRGLMESRNERGQKTAEGQNPSPQPAGISRYQLGWDTLQSLDPDFIHRLKAGLDPVSPELFNLVLEHGYADIFYRDNLDIRQREAAVVAAMVAVENADPQLSFHIKAAMGTGIDRNLMKDIIRAAAEAAGNDPEHALSLLPAD